MAVFAHQTLRVGTHLPVAWLMEGDGDMVGVLVACDAVGCKM